jgi:UDP-N-acetylglucosamine 2-epimerase
MGKKKVPTLVAPYFNRSERGPLQPLEKVAKGHQDALNFVMLDCTALKTADNVCNKFSKLLKKSRPDMVLCAFDRPLMALSAFVAYHMGYPISQIFAGDYAGGAFDDADRFCISNYANLLFCTDKPQYMRLQRALDWTREKKSVIISGATHFDDMTFQDPGIRDYELVLYNPSLYRGAANLDYELDGLRRMVEKCGREVVWVAPNGDPGSDKVAALARTLEKEMKNFTYMEDMPREKFLGLVKHAFEFIGNSSCMFYEAQYFQTHIIQVGYRNMYREQISQMMCRPGASKVIIENTIKYLREKGD